MQMNMKIAGLLAAAVAGVASQARADVWTIPDLVSGVTTVTYQPGPATTGFTSLASADFINAAANTAPTAALVATPNSAWQSGLASFANAKWINTGTNDGNTPIANYYSALYAVHFNWPHAATNQGTLQIHYLTDNGLGWRGAGLTALDYMQTTPLTAGLYLNGAPLTNDGVGTGRSYADTYTADPSLNNFDNTYSDPAYGNTTLGADGRFQEVANLTLVPGDNVLFINSSTTGQDAGVLFDAQISAPVPEPAALSLLLLAGSSLLIRRRRA